MHDNGTVTVAVNAPEDVHECIVLVPETDTVEVENGVPLDMTLPAGLTRFVAYAAADYVRKDGTVITSPGPDIQGPVYTCMTDFDVKAAGTSE